MIMSSPAGTSSMPSAFLANELQLALSEQHFGIRCFSILSPSTPLVAKASVTLLDGEKLQLVLTGRGYFIEDGSKKANSLSLKVFETVEELLQSVSDIYAEKRREVLWNKLEKLA
ncbi:hypothetical protein IW261DRAFT_620853 [Armillaria novae-zelandiae]|uniref:GSKIP domain-containing protein n=1 Tax=Armillaria novae-zelandiae TaxID=153914 RepID=A0AA39UHD8_9AGAR|nr:hypothetical protein IW261DRAFT_620853 [Armillaria novae-zelandiae]